MACDSRVTSGYEIVTDDCLKYVIAGSAVCLVSGNDGSLLEHLAQARNIEGVRLLANEYQEGKGLSWDLLCYCRRSEKLVLIDHAENAIVLGTFYATGSGGDTALGVLASAAAPRTLEAAARVVRKACEIACRHNAGCGGKIRVLTIRGKRSVPGIACF